MLPGGGTVVTFCGGILALGRWNLQVSWNKCQGASRGQLPGMAADKCIMRKELKLPPGIRFHLYILNINRGSILYKKFQVCNPLCL